MKLKYSSWEQINLQTYNEIKKKLENGSIILMNMNNDTAVELGIIIDYIRFLQF